MLHTSDIEEKLISKSFKRRYLEENARQRLGMEMQKFLLFREGKFINPLKKNELLQEYFKEEYDNFFNKKIINIPQIEFCITTKCTLKCKDCCALIPKFNSAGHIDMTFNDFKLYLDKLIAAVDMIRHFVILGGEPLINPDLPKMIDYACQQNKIFIVQLITNGTMKFNEELLSALKRNNKKAYVYISNYSINEALKPILKHEEIKNTLKENDIKLQMADNKEWVTEKEFATDKTAVEVSQEKIKECFRVQCNQVLNGHLDICSKAATARELGLLNIKDSVDIVNSKDLKQDLIDFYTKDLIDACEYCILSNEITQPAIQE